MNNEVLRRLAPRLPSSVSGGIALSVVLRIVTVVLSFASTVMVARMLGVEHFGTYAFVVSVIGVLARLVTFGIPELAVRVVSTAPESIKKSTVMGVALYGFATAATLTAVSCFVYYFFFYKAAQIDGSFAPAMWALSTVLPIGAFCAVLSAALNGLGKISETIIFSETFRLLVFLPLTAALVILVGVQPSPLVILQLAALSFLALMLVLGFRVTVAIRTSPGAPGIVVRPREWAIAAFGIGIFGFVTAAYQQSDILVLKWLATSTEVGLYQVANRSANLLTFVLAGATVSLSPLIAKLYSEGEYREIEEICNVTVRYMLMSCAPIAALFAVFGKYYLVFVFGSQYRGAYAPLLVMSLGYLLKVALEINQVVFFMTGVIWPIVTVNLVGLALCIGLSMLLVPTFGATGSALASSSSLLLVGLMQRKLAKKLLGIDISPVGSLR